MMISMLKRVSLMKWNKKLDILALMVGHGKSLDGSWDPGCAYGKYTEAGLMLPIVQAAVDLLRKSGVKVITDADDANNRNMKSSVAWAEKKKAKIYMSVHCDYSGAAAGVYPLYKDSADKKLAGAVGKKVAKLLGMKYRGAAKRTDLYELNAPTAEACCIFETGAIKADLKTLKESKKYGRALAKAILKYIGVAVYVTNRTRVARKASEFAYIGQPKKARYPGGKPKPEYKKGLKKAYPDRSSWGKAPRAGASCDVFAGTSVRNSGVDGKFPRGLSDQIKYLKKSKKFKLIKNAKVSTLKSGDIIIYQKKGSNKGHICIFVDKRIKHASYQKWYGRTTNNAAKMLSKSGKKFVRVYRAK